MMIEIADHDCNTHSYNRCYHRSVCERNVRYTLQFTLRKNKYTVTTILFLSSRRYADGIRHISRIRCYEGTNNMESKGYW